VADKTEQQPQQRTDAQGQQLAALLNAKYEARQAIINASSTSKSGSKNV
jgi:hypothetical protein